MVFLITMIISFLTEYVPDGETQPVRDLAKIAKNYMSRDFTFDIITLLPLPWIFMTFHMSHFLYIIKVFRTVKGIKVFDVTAALSWIKEIVHQRNEEKIKKDPRIAEDTS